MNLDDSLRTNTLGKEEASQPLVRSGGRGRARGKQAQLSGLLKKNQIPHVLFFPLLQPSTMVANVLMKTLFPKP